MKKERKKDVEVKDVEVSEEEVLSPFLAAYKKQNPAKYEIKKERGELKGL